GVLKGNAAPHGARVRSAHTASIVPWLTRYGGSAPGGAPRRLLDGGEVIRLGGGRLVLQVTAQREVRAAEGKVRPGNVRRSHQGYFETLRAGRVACRRQGRAEE